MKLRIDSTDNLKTIVQVGEASFEANYEQPREQNVLGAVVKALEEAGIKIQDITEVEVATGPGSFTGIRVGVSIAQAIAFALQINVNGISPLDKLDINYGKPASITTPKVAVG